MYITCFASLSKAFFECYFKLYLCLLDVKPKHFRGVCPLSLHHSSAMDLLGAYSNPRPIATFCAIQVFCAHMIGLLSVLSLGCHTGVSCSYDWVAFSAHLLESIKMEMTNILGPMKNFCRIEESHPLYISFIKWWSIILLCMILLGYNNKNSEIHKFIFFLGKTISLASQL